MLYENYGLSLLLTTIQLVYVCMYVYMDMFMCVCHMYIYVFQYVCEHVYMCAWNIYPYAYHFYCCCNVMEVP